MSSIPSSAMPHAMTHEDSDEAEAGTSTFSQRASKLADKARANPKTTIAAGAALVAGAVAVAAIPLVRSRKKSGGGTRKKTS